MGVVHLTFLSISWFASSSENWVVEVHVILKLRRLIYYEHRPQLCILLLSFLSHFCNLLLSIRPCQLEPRYPLESSCFISQPQSVIIFAHLCFVLSKLGTRSINLFLVPDPNLLPLDFRQHLLLDKSFVDVILLVGCVNVLGRVWLGSPKALYVLLANLHHILFAVDTFERVFTLLFVPLGYLFKPALGVHHQEEQFSLYLILGNVLFHVFVGIDFHASYWEKIKSAWNGTILPSLYELKRRVLIRPLFHDRAHPSLLFIFLCLRLSGLPCKFDFLRLCLDCNLCFK